MLFQEDEIGALAANPGLSRAILGTARAAVISRRLDAFCRSRLGSALGAVIFCEVSVGAAFGARLEDGRRVLLKAHAPAAPPEFLQSVHAVQAHLSGSGFPCPRPVLPPTSLGPGYATVEDFVEDGAYADAHDPEVRRLSARTLARLVRVAGEVPHEAVAGLARCWGLPPRGELWPEPHNALFDFRSTAAGSGWIGALAARARRVLDRPGEGPVPGHADWCSKHLRLEGGGVNVVYDWDSLRLDTEPAIVGRAAATFPANRHLDAPNTPTPEEAWLFIGEYEAARGRPFSGRQREVAAAAATYALAYLARCEHAADPARSGPDEYRRALCEHAAAYFGAGA